MIGQSGVLSKDSPYRDASLLCHPSKLFRRIDLPIPALDTTLQFRCVTIVLDGSQS